MQAVADLAAFAKYHGLFRAAFGADVTCKLFLGMFPCQTLSSTSPFKFLRKVSHVDLFISHSSKCPAWLKLVATCHYLNVDKAIVFSFLSCLMAMVGFVASSGRLSAVTQEFSQGLLFGCLFAWPMLVFVVAYVGGHLFSSRTFWFDQLCIDQQNLLLKSQALKAVPAFVAHATGMMVLLDETYFERLWCIYELAVHSKAALATELIPTWMPIWIGSIMSISFVAGRS